MPLLCQHSKAPVSMQCRTISLGAPQGREKPKSDCPGHVNFALRQVKIEV